MGHLDDIAVIAAEKAELQSELWDLKRHLVQFKAKWYDPDCIDDAEEMQMDVIRLFEAIGHMLPQQEKDE